MLRLMMLRKLRALDQLSHYGVANGFSSTLASWNRLHESAQSPPT